jgi:RND family efflux transporter MFP subunit
MKFEISPRYVAIALTGWLAVTVLAPGCNKPPSQAAPLPPEVTVAHPLSKEVMDYEYFTGRTEPVEQAEVRAQVSGYVTAILFKPGSEVKKGAPLFEIDARAYQAALEGAEAEVAQAEARATRLNNDFERANRLISKPGAISREEYDKIVGERAEALASIKVAKARVDTAKLDMEFTKITAPIGGIVGDKLVDVGNLVTGGQGIPSISDLTTIAAVDPMDVAFDVDENTLLRLQQATRDGRIKAKDGEAIPVEMGLQIHGSAYPFNGVVNFINNKVDTKTGTIKIKARFPNPKPEVGARVLVPGLYTRVRVPIGKPRTVLVVPESALGTDQGQRFLYVVNDQKVAVKLNVTPGLLQEGMREIEDVRAAGDAKPRSLRADEQVIVKGLQRVRPEMIVDPKSGK